MQASLDRIQEVADPGLWRIRPARQRDEIDLPPVQATEIRPQPPSRARRASRRSLGCGRQSRSSSAVACRRQTGWAPAPVDREHLRTPVQTQVQPPGSDRTGSQLSVHVVQVRSAYDDEVDVAQLRASTIAFRSARVGHAIWDGGAIPVEHDRLEAPVEILWHGSADPSSPSACSRVGGPLAAASRDGAPG